MIFFYSNTKKPVCYAKISVFPKAVEVLQVLKTIFITVYSATTSETINNQHLTNVFFLQ